MFYEMTNQRHRPHASPATPKPEGLIKDSWSAAVVDELAPHAGDVVMDGKHKFNSFYQTDLELILRNLGIKNLFFTGVTGSVCVETTFREAYMRDFRCILLEDCVWERFPDWLEATKRILSINFGYLSNSTEVCRFARRRLANLRRRQE